MMPPALDRTCIHLWTASLSADSTDSERRCAILSDDERARADRFRVAHARRRFIVCRAFLRQLLANYLRADPASLVFRYGAHGKPHLAASSGIHFNLSHADDVAMIAIAWQREVGIDIEKSTDDVDLDRVADRTFSPLENRALAALALHGRRDGFYRIWTRKEAYMKARGEGLGYPTRSFSVSHLPANDDALITDEQAGEGFGEWRISEIAAPTRFCAALAAQGRDWSVARMNFPAAPS